nr:hypothetical protein [Tanacetum cinerariifolium]
MHFLLTTLKVVYVLTTPMPELMEDATLEAIRIRSKWENDDYICRGHIFNEDSSSKKFFVSNFNNYKMVDSRPVMEQYNELLRILGQYTQHGLKMDESISVSSIIDKLPPSWKDFKHTLKHAKDNLFLVQLGSHLRIEESLREHESNKGKGKEVARPSVNMMEEGEKNKNNKQNKGKKHGFKDNNSGSGSNKKPKLECWKCGKTGHFKRDCRSRNKKNNASASGSGKGSKDQWWIDSGAITHVCKDCCWFKTYEPVKDGYVLYMGDDHFDLVHGKGCVVLEFSSRKYITLFNMLYEPKLGKDLIYGPILNKCGYKQVYESDKYILSKFGVFVRFGYYNNGMFMLNLNKVPDDSSSVYMSSSTVVNFSLWHARLGHVHCKRMLEMSKDDLIPAIDENTKKYSNKKYVVTFIDDAFRAVVRLLDPKKKTLGDKGSDCIFVGYAEHSNAYRFYVIEPNDSVSINIIIESRDAIFDENRFSSIPRPKYIIPNSDESQRDDHSNEVPSETPEPRNGIRVRKAKSHGYDFQLYLVEGSRDQIGSQYSCCYSIEEDPRTYNEAMKSRDSAFWLQTFRQKEGIDYFDTYAPVARITTIRLLLALEDIHNLVIHQMDVKTAFLNGNLEEGVYIKQPKGFVMPGNEHKVCKLVKSLYGLKQAPKQWHLNFDEVVLFNGFLLNQSDKCVHRKFDGSGNGVIICLYDMGEADVILGIKIKRENKGIVITQSHYIEKILKKFNRKYYSPVSTPMDPVEKLMPNTVLKGYSDASWINHVEDSSFTSGWLFLLGEVPFHGLPRSKNASLVLL